MRRTSLAIALGAALLCLAVWSGHRRTGHGPAYEMHALRVVHLINTAQTVYRSKYDRYARSLEELGPPTAPDEVPAPRSADLITSNMASGEAGGYRFLMIPNAEGYQILAFPQREIFGERSFYSDETAVIRAHKGRPAWQADPAVTGPSATGR